MSPIHQAHPACPSRPAGAWWRRVAGFGALLLVSVAAFAAQDLLLGHTFRPLAGKTPVNLQAEGLELRLQIIDGPGMGLATGQARPETVESLYPAPEFVACGELCQVYRGGWQRCERFASQALERRGGQDRSGAT